MSGVNKTIILGRLGQDPESIANGKGCRFSVATSETWKDKNTGEKKEKTQWHRIKVWGKLGELASKYLSKGRQVYLEGKLEYTKTDDGKYFTDIVLGQAYDGSVLEFVGGKNDTAGNVSAPPVEEEDNVPF